MVRNTILAAFFLSSSLASALPAANPQVLAKLSPYVRKQIDQDNNQIDALIVLSQQARLSNDLDNLSASERRHAVVDSLRAVATKSQASIRAKLIAKGIRFQPYYIHNMIAVYGVSQSDLMELTSRDDIGQVIGNPVVRALPVISMEQSIADARTAVGANITSTGADRVWSEFQNKGEGIIVAGQDTGYEWTHPALKTHYRGWNGSIADHNYNWHDAIHDAITSGGTNKCGFNAAAPCDDDQHGTHTMGTIVGDDGAGNQIGMAPGAKWIGCRNMDRGMGRPSTYIECFEFFLAPFPVGGDSFTDGDPDQAPHVINNSWGCTTEEGCTEAETLPVLKNLKAAGIMVVASAGNEGSGCKTIGAPPAMHSDDTFSVGAHNHQGGAIAYFSSRGPSKHDNQIGPDITAPGVSIRSSVPGGSYSGSMWSGTSMAGPHVVGAVALAWSADRSLIGNIDGTVQLFRSTATPKTTTENCGGVAGTSIPNNTFGWGHLDAYKAVASRLK